LGNTLLRKVLVVDDETELADLAAILLEAHGIEAITAYSAHAAIEILATNDDIDAVVSDIVMPGMTGLQLADTIREMYPRIKIVLTSGFTLPGKLAGRDRPYLFVSKPYRIETLLAILRS
jgi:CheY-like chemotaxis protein